jgi:DNA-binding response OmpR family regulator
MENISGAEVPARAAIQSRTNPPLRILVVDDEPDICRLNTEVLLESGYHVDAANDGAAAWQALNAGHYDLLITDNHMPTVTGLELIKKLRAEDMTLPVILMSATLPTVELATHPWLQIQATLKKPYTLTELLVTVKKVLHATAAGACEQFAPPPNWQSLPSIDHARQ